MLDFSFASPLLLTTLWLPRFLQNADKIKAPILLIHGEDDNNTGTFPMQVNPPSITLTSTGARETGTVDRNTSWEASL